MFTATRRVAVAAARSSALHPAIRRCTPARIHPFIHFHQLQHSAADTPSTPAPPRQVTVFHDGSCPLCKKEVAFFRRMDKHQRIEFVDVSDPEKPTGCPVTHEQLMARFHVRENETGQMYSGAAAFAAMWRTIPMLRPIAEVARNNETVLNALDATYTQFLKIRPAMQRFVKRIEGTPAPKPYSRPAAPPAASSVVIEAPKRPFHTSARRTDAPKPSNPTSASELGRSTRIPEPQLLPPAPTGSFWNLLGFAVGATVLFGVLDYFWVQSHTKERLEARIGFPLDVVATLKEARETMQKALEEKERYDAQARRVREQKRKHDVAEESAEAGAAGTTAAAADSADPGTDDDEAVAVLISTTPSLLEAERLYRDVLKRLNFRGIDLKQLHAWVDEGTASPAMRAVGQEIGAATKKRIQQQIDSVLDPSETNQIATDKRLLPYVLNLLAVNLQLQGEVLKTNDELVHGGSPIRPPRTSAAYRRMVQSESFYLQSLTLYRHHFQFDRRPYAVVVLEQLGSLYYDRGEMKEAEAVWIKCLELLGSAKRSLSLVPTTPGRKGQAGGSEASSAGDESQELTELADGMLPHANAYAKTASGIAEKLAMLHRTRGQYQDSIRWTQEALKEWDLYGTAVRKQSVPSIIRRVRGKPEPTAYDLAVLPLPRAMHLLTALSADMFLAGQFDQGYQVCLQSLQVLERIVQLQQAAHAAQSGGPKKPTRSEAASPLTHRHFLAPEFLEDLKPFLQAPESQSLSSVVHSGELGEEASAAFYNMAQLLKVQRNKEEAKKCIQQAKAIALWTHGK